MATVIDMDEARVSREARELGPARFYTLSEVHEALDLALDEVIGADFYVETEDGDDAEPEPCARIDGSFRVVKAQKRRLA